MLMLNKLITVILLGLFSLNAMAETSPNKWYSDNRIQTVLYDETDVVKVRVIAGIGVRIVFESDERLEDVAAGFTDGWSFDNYKNILYIKANSIESKEGVLSPEPRVWDTNVMVTTNKRLYDFDLRLLKPSTKTKSASNDAYWKKIPVRINFTYPESVDEKLLLAKAKREKDELKARLDSKPVGRNWDYTMRIGENSCDIAPIEAYDDGRFTYIKFSQHQPIPSFYLVDGEGDESILNFHQDPKLKNTIILHRISKQFNARLGNMVVQIYNENIKSSFVEPPNTGTIKKDVVRVIKGAGNE